MPKKNNGETEEETEEEVKEVLTLDVADFSGNKENLLKLYDLVKSLGIRSVGDLENQIATAE